MTVAARTSTPTQLTKITRHGSVSFCILFSVTSQLSRHAAYLGVPASADDKESDSPKRPSPLLRPGVARNPRCTAAPTMSEVGRC